MKVPEQVFSHILQSINFSKVKKFPFCPQPYLQRKLNLSHEEADKIIRHILRDISMHPRKVIKSDLKKCIDEKMVQMKSLKFEIAILSHVLNHLDDKNGSKGSYVYSDLMDLYDKGELKE